MREAAAIVEPAIDVNQITREILKEHIALQDDERNADAHEKKSLAFRDAARRRKIEIGRRLVEVKGVTAHGGWTPYLSKCGISSQDASEWMRSAGFVDRSNPGQLENVRDLEAPTRRDVGIDKRPRKSEEQPDPIAGSFSRGASAESTTPTLDIGRELSKMQDKLYAFAQSVQANDRKRIANDLRETARLIEEI